MLHHHMPQGRKRRKSFTIFATFACDKLGYIIFRRVPYSICCPSVLYRVHASRPMLPISGDPAHFRGMSAVAVTAAVLAAAIVESLYCHSSMPSARRVADAHVMSRRIISTRSVLFGGVVVTWCRQVLQLSTCAFGPRQVAARQRGAAAQPAPRWPDSACRSRARYPAPPDTHRSPPSTFKPE